MNKDIQIVEKNVNFHEQVTQIAKLLFHAFYFDEEEHFSDPDTYEKDGVLELADKADKIYRFFGSADDAKKAIRFLHTVNPIKAKEIFDEL